MAARPGPRTPPSPAYLKERRLLPEDPPAVRLVLGEERPGGHLFVHAPCGLAAVVSQFD
ncbi:hypothetical protein ACQPZP_10060 [Spirillospora sp. CA-142024]|uniref:hypothetical protein n=1 Tax=Spirillospora sp. CA-142024 TaxID=3240036 RepID=UPI003D910418